MVYAQGDTTFNESFATAVERLGGQRWLAAESALGNNAAQSDYTAFDQRRRQFRALTLATRRELIAIYLDNEDIKEDSLVAPKERAQAAIKSVASVAAKEQAMQRFRARYADLKTEWGGYAAYDPWVARANNAAFAAQAAYDELVPGFEALFEAEGRSWPRFYDAVRRLADLSKTERHLALNSLKNNASPPHNPRTD